VILPESSLVGRLECPCAVLSAVVCGRCARRFAVGVKRVVFGFYEDMLIALHGFVKKTQKTPAEDLALARQRLKEMMS
jgi:hypothetical protein